MRRVSRGRGEDGVSTDQGKLIGGMEHRRIELAEYDPAWPEKFRRHADAISMALADELLAIEHVGSTAVPGLAAKPIVDILVVVRDSAEEQSYLPALLEAGYQLRVREPEWHEHRMLRTPGLDVHVHVFSEACSEVGRMLAFRECLRASPADRQRYEAFKRELARIDWPDMNAYADAKTEVVASILAATGHRKGLAEERL